MSSYLVVGIGNPGANYQKNRHNLGFRVVDELACRSIGNENRSGPDTVSFRKTSKAFVAKVSIASHNLILTKPRTYVNRSGEAVLSLLTSNRIPKENILVICDDFSLPLGTLRLRFKGSSGGHNGLQSVIETVGNEFARLRLGIGTPGSSAEWADYVLKDFTPEEEAKLPEIIDKAVKEIIEFIKR
ncbi:MAG: aminoacyl-tRNA hydrolase [Candidatus Omnitrophica bacterium]|nr:aminoacyl-tRNA hydrolase [Candidatus Omnitrophota bacterium]